MSKLVRAVGDHRHMPADLVRDADLWPADHEVVAAHPDWFETLDGKPLKPAARQAARAAAPVEQATAAPGEKRATRRPAER